MKILSKYIAKHILLAIALVLLILLGVEIFVEFTREFSDIGTGFYGWLQASLYVPMMLPQDIYQFFPMAGLLGSLIGLGILATNSELMVMRASGMSVKKIAGIMLGVAVALTLFMVVLGEVVAPISQHKAMVRKTAAMGGGQTLLTRSGVWLRSDGNFIHINSVSSDGKNLAEIVRYRFNNRQELVFASLAEKGSYQNGKWLFTNVNESKFRGNRVYSYHFEEQDWGMQFNPRLLGITSVDTEQKSLPELYNYITYREQSGLDTDHYRLVFWQRVFQPLSILVMLLLAVPFIFGSLRRVTMGLRILIGVLVGFGFYTLNQFVGPISLVYQITPLFAAALPSVFFAVLAGFMVFKVR